MFSDLVLPVVSIASLVLSLVVVWRMNRKLSVFEDIAFSVHDLLRYEENEEGEPLLDARLAKMLDTFSSKLATSLRMSVLGSMGANKRLEKGLKGAVTQDFIEKKAPILNLVGDVLGFNTAKYIQDHPDAIMQLAPMLQGFMRGSSPYNPTSRKEDVFKLG